MALDFEENLSSRSSTLDKIVPSRPIRRCDRQPRWQSQLRLGRRSDIASNEWLRRDRLVVAGVGVGPDDSKRDPAQRSGSCRDHCAEPEIGPSRARYFSEVFDQFIDPVFARTSQPQYWFSNSWNPCKANAINGARVARREIYDRFFRQWHWRIAGEQLIYSHVDRVDHFDNKTPFRWELNTVRQLLMAGQDDNFQGSNIFDATRTVASLMVHTPGESMFLAHTGHSMHIERPAFVAAQIVRFLDPMIAAQTMSFQITCIRKEGRKDQERGRCIVR
jgi:pimeloyl-ACP methyl ester carboxylesterase